VISLSVGHLDKPLSITVLRRLWTLKAGQKGDKEERNRADQISPRRPEVHRVGVMHSYPNDGLNFFSPDPWWCISDIRSVLEDIFARNIPPHATLDEVAVSQTVFRLHISIGSCGANRRGGEEQPRHSSPSTTETTTQRESRGSRSCCRSSGIFLTSQGLGLLYLCPVIFFVFHPATKTPPASLQAAASR
jgi:hypothetical protein